MKTYTTKEAALLANLSSSNGIRQAILRGRMIAEKHGRDWLITEGELNRWLKDEKHRKAKTGA